MSSRYVVVNGEKHEKFVPEPKKQDMLAPQRTLFITGLDDNCTAETLMGAFIPFGDITEVVRDPGQSHGFVEFEDPEVCQFFPFCLFLFFFSR